MPQPNILLFLTDDHGAWALGANGNHEIRSPILDGIARDGANFRNAFTPCPVCSPARACLITGRTPSQVGIHDWLHEGEEAIAARDWLRDEITLPELLQNAGYHCGLSGKWHLGQSHQTPRGFNWCFGLPRWQGAHIEEYTYHLNGNPLTLNGNKTSFTTDYTLQFLDEAPPDKPFFLNVGYISTHSPYSNQEPELLALYENATFEDIPPYVPHRWHKNEGFPQGEAFNESEIRSRHQTYYAAVSDIDRSVGRILDRLRERGQLENTLVIYTSDHGCALGHQGFWGKGNSTRPLNMHEVSLRVPLVMRGPGIVPGTVVRHCVDHYDTFQFVCEIAEVEVSPRDYPGQSYALLLREARVAWDEVRFGEYGDLRMIRTPHFKLVRRYPDGPDDLFDLQADPDETTNLAAQDEYAETRAALLQRLEEWYAEHKNAAKSGLNVKQLPRHNAAEAWRDGLREARGLQIY